MAFIFAGQLVVEQHYSLSSLVAPWYKTFPIDHGCQGLGGVLYAAKPNPSYTQIKEHVKQHYSLFSLVAHWYTTFLSDHGCQVEMKD